MTATRTASPALHPDTQAILLLCGTFGKATNQTSPLNLREYNALAQWLGRHNRRPADLLDPSLGLYGADETDLPAPDRLKSLLARGVQMATAVERWQRLGLWVISRGEAGYPVRLRRHLKGSAPALLYGAGDIGRLDRGGLALVGSRDIDEEGLSFTRRVAERCAAEKIQVISGGARGVDQAAVSAALAAGGSAVVVLSDRLDRAVTTRDARVALQEDTLTLVSPYEPEVPFHVGRAMGRNKHLYVLADHALVVRFTTDTGGTWEGAIEQLQRKKNDPATVPVFVRATNNPEDGLAELYKRGALPFPEQEFWDTGVSKLLDLVSRSAPLPVPALSRAEPSVEPAPLPVPTPRTPADQSTQRSAYHLCLPLILEQLHQEPDEKALSEIASRLELLPGQLKEWLGKAIQEGKVRKIKKNRRNVYTAATVDQGTPLFPLADGDAA